MSDRGGREQTPTQSIIVRQAAIRYRASLILLWRLDDRKSLSGYIPEREAMDPKHDALSTSPTGACSDGVQGLST